MNSLKIILLVGVVLLFSPLVFGLTYWSTENTFNVTPGTGPVTLNQKISYSYERVINITMNSSYAGNLTVDNSTASHTVKSNYSQPDSGWTYKPVLGFSLTACGLSPSNRYPILVKNGTGHYVNSVSISAGGRENMTIIAGKEDCPPGRYRGFMNVTDDNDPTNYSTMEVVADLSISSSNSFNNTVGKGQFKGTIPAGLKTTYPFFYFNTSEIENATAVTVSLSWENVSNDIDLFLDDANGVETASSLNKDSFESLNYNYINPNEIWSIILFGNESSEDYNGFLMFSTLNATNASDTNHQFSLINFGNKNPSDSETVDVRLESEGSLNLTSVSETSELYHTEEQNSSGSNNFTTRIPDFTQNIIVFLEWDWNSNSSYTLKLFKPDGTPADNSSGKHINPGVVQFPRTELVEYDPPGTVGFSEDGFWRIEVLNNTPSNDPYNLTVKKKISATNWVSTDYNTTTFDAVGEYEDFEFNFTVQNKSLGGLYNGSLKYTSSSGAILEVPFTFNVTTPELMVNGSFNNSTITLNENIGFNRTIVLNITVNNTGNDDLTLSDSGSVSIVHSSNSSNYMNFSYNAPSSISAGGSDLLDITIDIDTTKTNNNDGVYAGWIFLNDSNAHPYDGFNLTLNVDLSDNLKVYLVNISTADGDGTISNASLDENITLDVKVFYANDTSTSGDLSDISNFGKVYLRNKNVTSYRIPSSSSDYFNIGLAVGSLYQAIPDEYWINATLTGSSTRPGGYYNVYLTANKTNGGQILSGIGSNGTLIISGAGLYITQEDGVISKYDEVGETDYYEVRVVNYGTVAVLVDDIDLIFTGSDDDECDAVMSDTLNDTTCGSNIVPGETCYYTWKLRLASDTDYVLDCEIRVDTDKNYYGSMPDDSFEVSISDDSGDSGDSDGDDTEDIDITSYPSSISVVQNKSKDFDIEVKNDGDTDEDDIELTITGINSSWYSHSPSNLDLDSGDDDKFEVTISVPEDAEVKEYSITFKVANDDVSDSKTSKLKVMPSEEEKESINETYLIYLENYTTLEDYMKEMMWEGKNVTELNTTLLDIKSKLNSLNQLIENEDYYNAAQKLNEIESLLTTAQSLIEQEELLGVAKIMEEASNYVWLFVGVVIIIIAGFLIYMFMPAPKESYKVKKFKYTSPEAGESIGKKIKKQLKKISVRLKGIKKEKNKKTGYAWKKK